MNQLAVCKDTDSNCMQLLENLGVDNTNRGLKTIAFRGRYETQGGASRFVFVFRRPIISWPGLQPETVVVTDLEHRLITWKEVGGSPAFLAAVIDAPSNRPPLLKITRLHRPGFLRGTHVFSLRDDRIVAMDDVHWEPTDLYQRDW